MLENRWSHWEAGTEVQNPGSGPGNEVNPSCYKHIWYSQTGREQLFDLNADPHECRDLARDADALLELWRQKLIGFLRDRPEGFVEADRLVAGRPHEPLMPDYEPNRVYPFL